MTRITFPSFSGKEILPYEMRQLVSALDLRFSQLELGGSSRFDLKLLDTRYSQLGHTHTESEISDLQPYLVNLNGQSIFSLVDVDGTPIAGDSLVWSGTSFVPSTPGAFNLALNDLNNVNVPAPADTNVLRFNAASNQWIAASGNVGTANSPAVGEYARFTDPSTIEGRTVPEVWMDLIPVTDAEAIVGAIIINGDRHAGDVIRYGTNTIPGTTNMGTALATAIAQNEQSGGAPIVTHAESYYISTGLTWLAGGQDHKQWYSHNSIITTDQDIIPLTVGPLSGGGQTIRSGISGDLEVIQTSASTKQGFLFGQVYEGKWHLSADGFDYGLECTTAGSGCAYNNFYIGKMNRCLYGVYLHPTSGGWVNENNFWGGRFANGAITQQWHIYMPKAVSGSFPQPNNNKFYGVSLENPVGGTMEGFYLDGGVGNLIHHPRQENNGTINEVEFWLTTDSIACTVDRPYLGFAGNEAAAEDIRDEGVENITNAIDKMRWSARQNGQASTMLDYYRSRANNAGVPMQHMRDYYTQSQDGMAYKSSIFRETSTGYHYQATDMGSVVTGADGRDYHCIVGHTSASTDEPGVGVNWATFWERLPSTAANGATWVISTVYVAEVNLFTVDPRGTIVQREIAAPFGAVSGYGKTWVKDDSPTTLWFTNSAGTAAQLGGVPTTITVANEAADTTSFPAFFTAATGNLSPKTNAGITFNALTADFNSTLIAGIANANLVDKSATEIISGAWTFDLNTAVGAIRLDSIAPWLGYADTDGGVDEKYWSWGVNNLNFRLFTSADASRGTQADVPISVLRSATSTAINSITLTATSIAAVGAFTATSYGGIVEANLVDKSASEAISGAWTFGTAAQIEFLGGTDLWIRDAGFLRIHDSADTDYGQLSHDGIDFNGVFVGTTDVTLTGHTRDLLIGDTANQQTLAGGPWTGVADHAVRLEATTNDDNIEFALSVFEGDNNRRARFFLSDEQAVFGLQGSASTGIPTFQLYLGNTLVMSSTSTVVDFPVATQIDLGTFSLDADQTVGSGQDNYVLTYTNATGLIALKAQIGSNFQWKAPNVATPALTDQSAALQFYGNDSVFRTKMDLSAALQIRLISHVTTAGATGSYHEVRYFTSNSTTVGDYLTIGSSAVRNVHTATGIIDTGWIALVSGAKIDNCAVALVMDDGDGAADPVVDQITMYFR